LTSSRPQRRIRASCQLFPLAGRLVELHQALAVLIRTVDSLRSSGRSLVPYQVPDLQDVEKWLADNEVLDPNGPSEMLENLTQGKLLRGLRQRIARFRSGGVRKAG